MMPEETVVTLPNVTRTQEANEELESVNATAGVMLEQLDRIQDSSPTTAQYIVVAKQLITTAVMQVETAICQGELNRKPDPTAEVIEE